MQKSYNPFKMWGSWVGAVAPWLLLFFAFVTAEPDFLPSGDILLFLTILGFFIGWGIHSLVRRLK